jgi:hypothetical protein
MTHIACAEAAGALTERMMNVKREIAAWLPFFKQAGMRVAPESLCEAPEEGQKEENYTTIQVSLPAERVPAEQAAPRGT